MGRVRSFLVLVTALLLLGSPHLRAQTGVEPSFAPGEAPTNIVGVRFKFTVITNLSSTIKIIFCSSRLFGASNETYLLENNVYADDLVYTNGICTTWPQIGSDLAARSSIRSAIPDYNEHGWTGTQPLSPVNFPRQSYFIDGINGLLKMDNISQTNLNGVDGAVELVRLGLVTDGSGWRCSGPLDTNVVFREWDSHITFGGVTYTNRFALPDTNARYLTSYEPLDFLSEFLGNAGAFKVHYREFERLLEGETVWRRMNQFTVYRQDAGFTNCGARVVFENGENVIEMSNTSATTNYLPVNTVFDLSLATNGPAPDLAVVSLSAPVSALPGQSIQVIATITNQGSVAAGPFAAAYFVTSDPDIALNDEFAGTEMQLPGLAAFASVTITNTVTLPPDFIDGHYLGLIADASGVLIETTKTNNTAAVVLQITSCLPSAGDAVTNNWTMPDDFADAGWLFENFPDTRTNVAPGGATSLAALSFAGDISTQNGSVTNDGPAYTSDSFFPFVIWDTNRACLIMHPAVASGVAVGFSACRSGTYHLRGAFARANDFQFAGDGVAVAIVRNLDTTNLLFSQLIPSSAFLDPGDYFNGDGVAPFDLTLALTKGETLSLVVYNGTNGDIGFDGTALTFTLSRAPAPIILLDASRSGNNLLIQWDSLVDETYNIYSSTNLFTWTLAAQVNSTGTNRVSWLTPFTSTFQAFRVSLAP